MQLEACRQCRHEVRGQLEKGRGDGRPGLSPAAPSLEEHVLEKPEGDVIGVAADVQVLEQRVLVVHGAGSFAVGQAGTAAAGMM